MTPPEDVNAPTSSELGRAHRLADGLYPHQVDGLAFLLSRRRAILADDMGLGKTRQSILGMTEGEPGGPFLVVCPASVKLNWVREIQAVLGQGVPVQVVDRKNPLPPAGPAGWAVINYSILKKHMGALVATEWSGIVFDEAHYLKNHRSLRSRTARELLASLPKPPRVHCLTGTPLTNRPRDLFPLLQLVNHPLGRSFLSYARRYCDAYRSDYGWVTDGASNIGELTVQLHGTMLRRRKEEVLDLPGKVRTWLPVEIPDTTGRRETRRMLEEMIAARATRGPEGIPDERTEPTRAILAGRIQPARERIAIAKVKNTIGFVEGVVEQGEKVIVYSCFTVPSERVQKHFGRAAVTITGKTPSHNRQAIVDRFQEDPTVRVLAGNIIAAGVGVNLTAARTVVFNDLDWVPANHWQAEDRAYRIGQQYPVNVYYFTATGTIEEFIAEVLETKSQLITDVVEGRALAPDGIDSADVLSELQRMIQRVTARMDGEHLKAEAAVELLLDEAVALYRRETDRADFYASPRERPAGRTPVVTPAAIEALARALDPPVPDRYRAPSRRGEGWYTLEVDGSDVACSCRGFYYRGQCAHARELKEALAGGASLPQGFRWDQ